MVNSCKPQLLIREHLAQGGTLTVQQAFHQFGTTELRKVVARLRRKGDIISDRWTSSESEGRKSRYKIYYMVKISNS